MDVNFLKPDPMYAIITGRFPIQYFLERCYEPALVYVRLWVFETL